MIFFLDENISQVAARLLEAFDRDCEIRHLLAYFEQGTPDTVWIPGVSAWEEKPVVVCGDGRILRREAEKVVLRQCDLTFVFLDKGWTNLKWEDFAWRIIKVWPTIKREVMHVRRSTIFGVNYSSLKVENHGLTSERR